MGTLVGHVAPGFGFFLIGLWHLFNHIKLHFLHQNSYTSLPWFPASKFKYSELLLIMGGSCLSIAMELFFGPSRHQPFDPDFTIPSNHLHNFEHASISMTFFVYAAFAILLDRIGPKRIPHPHQYNLTQWLAAVAFGQQLLLFHLHSADHMGMEGQYHLLLQLLILVTLTTTLMGIGFPKSFLISFVRSLGILSQGAWLMVMGFMIWTPQLVPKGCFLHLEEGHQVVGCTRDQSLHRAKALVNLLFSWFVIGMNVFAVSFYLFLGKMYGELSVEYNSLEVDEVVEDVESSYKESKLDESKSFIQMGKAFRPIDMER